MLEPYKGRAFDLCCGSGGMFAPSENFVEAHGGRNRDISIFGQKYVLANPPFNVSDWPRSTEPGRHAGLAALVQPPPTSRRHPRHNPANRLDNLLGNNT